MKYWISLYALSEGIFEVEVKKDYTYDFLSFYYPLKHIHKTKEAAQSAADEMRKNAIDSLQKQIERLEKMEF